MLSIDIPCYSSSSQLLHPDYPKAKSTLPNFVVQEKWRNRHGYALYLPIESNSRVGSVEKIWQRIGRYYDPPMFDALRPGGCSPYPIMVLFALGTIPIATVISSSSSRN